MGVATVAVLLLLGLMLLATPEEESRLRVEAGKALIQVLAVVVLGAALTVAGDAYRERRQRALRAHELRSEMHSRLVKATNVLRRAGSRIEADRSVRTWSEQMREVIDAGHDLRVVRHEIEASANFPKPQPFTEIERRFIDDLLGTMYGYVNRLDDEFREHNTRLSADQRDAEWEQLQKLQSVADLTRTRDVRPQPEGAKSFDGYLSAYEAVVNCIVRADAEEAPQRRHATGR